MNTPDSHQDFPETKARKSRRVVWWSLAIAIFIIYPLSTGPIFKLAQYDRVPFGIMKVYAPLDWLGNHCTPLGSFLHWYVLDVWRVQIYIP
jgi:hypothetical protein